MHGESALSFVKDNFLILIILLLGLVLRIYDLGGENLWLDEFFSVETSRLGLTEMFGKLVRENESNPPFYYIALHYWISLFGESEFAIRLPSALLGTFSIFFVYLLGKLLFNRNTGLLAALILAASVFQIKFSQEARAYALMMFFGLLSLYFFYRLFDSRSIKFFAGYVISSVLLLQTHYYAVLIIAAQNFYFLTILLLKRGRNELTVRRWVFSQLILLVTFLPEIIYLKDARALHKGFWLAVPSLETVLETFLDYSGSTPLLLLFSLLSVWALAKTGAFLRKMGFRDALGSSGTSPSDRAPLNGEGVYFILVILFFLIAVPFFISHIFTPLYYARYTIVASGAFYILAALGIEIIRNNGLKLLFISLIIVFSGINLYGYYNYDQKPRWKEAIKYIDDNSDSGDVLAIYPFFETGGPGYYSKRKDLEVMNLFELSDLNFNLEGGSLWLIITERTFDDFDNYRDTLMRRYEIVSEKEVTQLRVYQLTDKSD